MGLPQVSSGGSGAYIDKGVKPRGKNAVNTCLYTRGIKLLSTKFFRWSKKKYCIYNYALIKEIVDHWNEDKRMNNRVKLHICIKLFVSPKLAFFSYKKSNDIYRFLPISTHTHPDYFHWNLSPTHRNNNPNELPGTCMYK